MHMNNKYMETLVMFIFQNILNASGIQTPNICATLGQICLYLCWLQHWRGSYSDKCWQHRYNTHEEISGIPDKHRHESNTSTCYDSVSVTLTEQLHWFCFNIHKVTGSATTFIMKSLGYMLQYSWEVHITCNSTVCCHSTFKIHMDTLPYTEAYHSTGTERDSDRETIDKTSLAVYIQCSLKSCCSNSPLTMQQHLNWQRSSIWTDSAAAFELTTQQHLIRACCEQEKVRVLQVNI